MTPILKQVKQYQRFSQTKSYAHYLHAYKVRRKRALLCAFVLLIVGVTIFATITKSETNLEMKLFTGFLSVMAVILVFFLTFVRFSEIAQSHKNTAEAYQANAHNLDLLLLANPSLGVEATQKALKELYEITTKLHQILETAPTLRIRDPNRR